MVLLSPLRLLALTAARRAPSSPLRPQRPLRAGPPPVLLQCYGCSDDASAANATSVTGTVYSGAGPTVRLFTKAGCTLCDDAKAVLRAVSAAAPHSLEAVDITDAEHEGWFRRYKYDIPVLHINGQYWAKHRITLDDTLAALQAAQEGSFEAQRGEPDAGRLERPK